jgi:PAS domain-containing protein
VAGLDEISLLIVEADVGEATLLAGALRDVWPGEFRTSRVRSLVGALQRLDAGGIDVVLHDLAVPDRPGLDGLEALLDHAPAVPVVVLTGEERDEVGLRAVETGAQDHIVIGADGYRLGRALRYAVERKRVENGLLDIARVHESAVAALREGVIVRTRDGHVTSVNPAVSRLLGIDRDEAWRVDLLDERWDAVHADGTRMKPDDIPSRRALISGEPQDDVVVGLRCPNRDRVWFTVSARPLYRLGEDEPYGTVTSFQPVVEGADLLASRRTV